MLATLCVCVSEPGRSCRLPVRTYISIADAGRVVKDDAVVYSRRAAVVCKQHKASKNIIRSINQSAHPSMPFNW